MQVMLESTTKIVEFVVKGGGTIKARIWEGDTDSGVRMHAYIVRVAVDKDADDTEFKRELEEHAAPTAEIQAIPFRLIL